MTKGAPAQSYNKHLSWPSLTRKLSTEDEAERWPVESTDAATLQGFAHERTNHDTMVFTDEARTYDGLLHPHERVSTASRSS